jgi:hypothetical protein
MDLETLRKNSMTYWYPKIKDLVPTPKTFMVKANMLDWLKTLDDETPDTKDEVMSKLMEHGRELGYPLFLRTDYTSAKHHWDNTCFVQSEDVLYDHIVRLVDESCCIDQAFEAFFVREFLDLESVFKAFEGMPIAKEFRVFCKGHKVVCVHPYWPMDSLHFYPNKGTPRPDDWEELMGKLYYINPVEFIKIINMALKATSWSEDAWSVDICKTTVGDWYVTDMALAGMSYHWAGCKNVRELSFEGYNQERPKPRTEPSGLFELI